jgi:hypothetical protein
VQTGGVIFNLTATALGTVGSTTLVDILWARPGTDTVGPNVDLEKIDLRFPNNQRGYETASDMSQAANVDYNYVMADTAVAQASLVFPVSGTYGLTSTASGHEENFFKNSYAVGYYVGLDLQSEHTTLINSFAINGAYCINYGVRGGNIYHASVFIDSGWGECAHGLLIGANVQNQAPLDISGLDIEDATSGIWAPVNHATETNSGYTFGRISYSRVIQGTGISLLSNLFDGGGGTSFQLQNASISNFGGALGASGPGSALTANSTQLIFTGGFGEIASTGPNTGTVPDFYIAGHSLNNTLTDLYLHFIYNTSATFHDLVIAPNFVFNSAYVSNTASEGLWAFSGGSSILDSFGANTATAGDVTLQGWSSDLSVNAIYLHCIHTGVACSFAGAVTAPSYATATNCSSAAAPAVCGSATSGSVVVAAAGTTVVVDTTAVTANSQIQLTFDSSLGTRLSVTCNTSIEQPTVSARTAGTSFTITVPTTVSTNPDCISYTIVN